MVKRFEISTFEPEIKASGLPPKNFEFRFVTAFSGQHHFCAAHTVSFPVCSDYRITPKGVLSFSRSRCFRFRLVGISAFKSIRENYFTADFAAGLPFMLIAVINTLKGRTLGL
jgi:hypothetical protein